MPKPTLARLTLLLPLALAGCGGGSSPDALAKQQVTLMESFADTLAKVTDKASAEKHKGALESVIKDIQALQAKVAALPKDKQEPSAEQKKALEPKMEAAMNKFAQEVGRIMMNLEVAEVLGPIMEKVPQ